MSDFVASALTPSLAPTRTFRAKLSDGREVVGAFKCMDGNGNFILSSALETRNGTQRHLGLVMVPGKHLVKMEVGQTADRKDDVLEAADVRQEGIATS